MSERLQYCCEEHGWEDYTPCPTCYPKSESASPNKPGVDIAHQWLKKNRQEWNGPISTWTSEQMDRYHTDLGMLVDFVTDCWPKPNGWVE